MLDRETLAGAAEAGHHLVDDKQDVVATADFRDYRPVLLYRRHRASGRAHHRLGDKCGDRVGAVAW